MMKLDFAKLFSIWGQLRMHYHSYSIGIHQRNSVGLVAVFTPGHGGNSLLVDLWQKYAAGPLLIALCALFMYLGTS